MINKANILRLVGILVIVMVMATSVGVWAFKSSAQSPIMTYEQAMKVNKPFVAMFHSEWCGYCKQFMPEYIKLAKEYKGKYNFVTISGDDPTYRQLMMDYRIGSFPSLYIIDPAIENRVFISGTFYSDIGKLKGEFDRYLRIRAMIK